MIDRGEKEGNMGVIAPVRHDYIDEGRAGRIAQLVQLIPNFHVFLTRSAALFIFIHPVCIQYPGCCFRGQKSPFRILRKERLRKAVETDHADNGKEYDKKQHNSADALDGSTLFQQFHFVPSVFFPVGLYIIQWSEYPRSR